MTTTFACSWSGGKDSCLALYRAVRNGWQPARLLTMLTEDGERSRSHGLPTAVVQAQADAVGIPLHTGRASWQTYEVEFTALLEGARDAGIHDIVFGDIDLQDHRDWEERVCAAAGTTAHLPLWQAGRMDLLQEFWGAGFETRIVVVRADVLGPEYLGRMLTPELAREFEQDGIDACGENGEFHTIVTGGPIFRQPLRLRCGEAVQKEGCWVQDVNVTS